MGGIPSGILEGVLSSFGEYNECLEIASPPDSPIPIKGQYCLAKPIIPHPDRASVRRGEPLNNILSIPEQYIDETIDLLYLLNGSLINIGLCLPSTCSAIDVQNSVNQSKVRQVLEQRTWSPIWPVLKIAFQFYIHCLGFRCKLGRFVIAKIRSWSWMSIRWLPCKS